MLLLCLLAKARRALFPFVGPYIVEILMYRLMSGIMTNTATALSEAAINAMVFLIFMETPSPGKTFCPLPFLRCRIATAG